MILAKITIQNWERWGWDPKSNSVIKRSYIPILNERDIRELLKRDVHSGFKRALEQFLEDIKHPRGIYEILGFEIVGRYLTMYDTILIKKYSWRDISHELAHSIVYGFLQRIFKDYQSYVKAVNFLRNNLPHTFEEGFVEAAVKKNLGILIPLLVFYHTYLKSKFEIYEISFHELKRLEGKKIEEIVKFYLFINLNYR